MKLVVTIFEQSADKAIEAIRGLGQIGGDFVCDDLLKSWRAFTPATRAATAEVLVSRRRWATALLALSQDDPASAREALDPLAEMVAQLGVPEPAVCFYVPDAVDALVGVGGAGKG